MSFCMMLCMLLHYASVAVLSKQSLLSTQLDKLQSPLFVSDCVSCSAKKVEHQQGMALQVAWEQQYLCIAVS